MVTLTEFLNSFEKNSKQPDQFLRDFFFHNADTPFDTREAIKVQNTIVTTINTRLNQESTHHDGLMLLEYILPLCEKDTLSKYGILWITKASRVLENIHSSVEQLVLACKVLANLVALCKDIPEIYKQISMQHTKQLLNIVDNLKSDVHCGATYYLIATLLYHYPEACVRFQAIIRKLISKEIDSSQTNVACAAAKCYALLSKVTERSFKPPPTKANYTGWVYDQITICSSLNDIMNEFFDDLIEPRNIEISDRLKLQSLPEGNVIEFYTAQKQRFINLCIYLSTMLSGSRTRNSASPADILQVLCRGLAITPTSLRRNSEDSVKKEMLYLILPTLHISLLDVLNAFIDGFRQELVPYGSTILQLFRQTLEWTGSISDSQATIANVTPYKSVRISLYKCLSTWLICTNSLSGIETVAQEYLPHLLQDISLEQDCILLTMQKVEHNSKAAAKRHRDSQYEKGLSSSTNNALQKRDSCRNRNADLSREALIALQNIFFSSGIPLKHSFFKSIENAVVPLLYDVYLNPLKHSLYKENAECRLHLLKTLRVLVINPHPAAPSPLQYSIEIFQMALNDNDRDVIEEARLALSEIEKVVHPVAPTLQLALRGDVGNGNGSEDSMEDLNGGGGTSDKRQIGTDEYEDVAPPLPPPPSNKRPKIAAKYDRAPNSTSNSTEKTVDSQDLDENENGLQTDSDDTPSMGSLRKVSKVSKESADQAVESLPKEKGESRESEASTSKEETLGDTRNETSDEAVSSKDVEGMEIVDDEEILQLFQDVPKDVD